MRFGSYDFYSENLKSPEDLQALTSLHESLPFRRRGYERDAMLETVIARSGYEAIFRSAQHSHDQLAAIPLEIHHVDLSLPFYRS